MTAARNFRVSDRSNLAADRPEGFIFRKRSPMVTWVARLFLWGVIAPLGVWLIVHYDTLNAALFCVAVGAIVHLLGRHIGQLKRILHNTEFLNTLFSSALGDRYAFCAVARQDGEIIYADHKFQELFPAFMQASDRSVAGLFDSAQVEATPRASLLESIAKARQAEIHLQCVLDGNAQTLSFAVEPIAKPKGFVLLRGRNA